MPDVEELKVGMSLDASGVESGAKRAEKALEDVADAAEKSGERSASGISEVSKAVDAASKALIAQIQQISAKLSAVNETVRQNGQAVTDVVGRLSAVNTTAKQAANGTKEVDDAMKALGLSAQVSDRRMAEITEEMQTLADQKRVMESQGYGLGFADYDRIVRRMNELKEVQAEYRRNLSQPMTVNVDTSRVTNLSAQLRQAQEDLKSLAGAGFGFGDANYDAKYQEVLRLTQAVKDYKAELARTPDESLSVWEQVANRMERAFTRVNNIIRTRLVQGLQMAGRGVANVAGRLLSMTPGGAIIRGIADRLHGVRSSSDGASGGLARMVRQIRNINIAGMAMRGMTLIFGRLRSVIQEYLSQNQAAQNAVNGLKTAFANALAPAINIAINALNAMLPVVQAISNAFATLVTNLFGEKWTTISGAASAVGDVASATRDAASAQKAYNAELYGFDQITKQSDNSSGGSSGGGGGGTSTSTTGGGSGMIGKFSEFFTEVSNLFKNGEWANLGTYLAESFGNAVDTAYNFLTSAEVYNKIDSAVNALGTTVNSFFRRLTLVDDSTGNSIAGKVGETIGAAINMAFHTVNSLLTDIDWGEIGRSIAQAINGAVKKTDWKQIGNTLANWFLALPKTLYSIIINTDWGAVAEGITDMIRSSFQTITDWLSTVDWAEIGHSVADFLLGIDWIGIVSDIIEFFVTGFAGLGEAIVTAIGDIVPAVKNAFANLWNQVTGNSQSVDVSVNPTLQRSGRDLAWQVQTDFGTPNVKVNDTLITGGAGLRRVLIKDFGTPNVKVSDALKTDGRGLRRSVVQDFGTPNVKINLTTTNLTKYATDMVKGINGELAKKQNYIKPKAATIKWNVTQSTAGPQLAPEYRFAKGGIVSAATLFGNSLVGEDGREAILPLERNTEWMDTWARKAAAAFAQMTSGGGGTAAPMIVKVMLPDGRVLGETVVDYATGEAKRTGQLPWAAYA